MLLADQVQLLESGCALIVGTCGTDRTPYASRAWGLEVVDPAGTVRVLLDAADDMERRHLEATGMIAVTGAHIRTLRSIQVKGRVDAVTPATPDDLDRSARYCDDYFAQVNEVDAIPRELMTRMVPPALMVCRVQLHEVFDQTPGPSAGAKLA